MSEEYEEVWQEGYEAYFHCPVPPCPYPWNSRKSIAWFTGLCVAKSVCGGGQ